MTHATLNHRSDKHLLYQASVQCPEFELDFIEKTYRKMRGRKARTLREDFCGTALSSCEWVKRNRYYRAVAFDIDQAVLDWGIQHNVSTLTTGQKKRLKIINHDVLTAQSTGVDVCQAFNFSYWVFQERRVMVNYFRNILRNLNDDGVLFLDAFGGYEAHKVQREKRTVNGFSYIWEQQKYNAVTAEMHCKIHFKFKNGKKIDNAFSYVWRVWGCREIREMLIDAGFSKTTLYLQAFDEQTDEPLDHFEETDYAEDYACWVGYIVAGK